LLVCGPIKARPRTNNSALLHKPAPAQGLTTISG
jgi:hypothetical protein